MVEFKDSDLFASGAEVLVNTVNLNGFMGKGVALQFKETYPENFQAYAEACKNQTIAIGKLLVVPVARFNDPTKFIVNFPTKKDYKHKSKREYIEKGLADFAQLLPRLNVKSVAMPPLGCGLGGLDWNKVKPLLVEFAEQFPEITFQLFLPTQKVYEGLQKQDNPQKVIRLTPIRTAILTVFNAYLVLDFEITLIEINKIVYFLSRMGFDFGRLDFIPGDYGPYAPKLRYVLQDLEGRYIRGLTFQKPRLFDELYLDETRIPEIEAAYSALPEPNRESIKQTIHLIDGFETPHGMELLATVDWVVNRNLGFEAPVGRVVEAVHGWNERKRKFMTPYQIEVALHRLQAFEKVLNPGVASGRSA
jgi:O-acetyl-ADP-ribose deacetylase (regulator of RNase III)